MIGYSDAKLSKRFLIDRLTLSTIRHDLEMRYFSLFQWVENFRRETARLGYLSNNNKYKYFDG